MVDRPPDVSLYDPQNPHSLVNRCDSVLRESLMSVPQKYLEMTERMLRKSVKPDETLCRLKLSLWDEYARSMSSGHKMSVSRIVRGVCTREYFYSVVLRSPQMMAWIGTPPVEHTLQLREILSLGLESLRAMVKTPFYTVTETFDPQTGKLIERKKKPDAAVMAQINKAVTTLMDRVHGSVVQRQANLNVNVEKSDKAPESLEEIEALEAQIIEGKE